MSYQEVRDRVAAAAERSGRAPESVTLVAVSKTKTVDEILQVYDLGQRDFGENRAQELAEKAPRLPDDIKWHFIGHLQSNKARLVRGSTRLLHSMDRTSLAKAWLKGHGMPPPVLLQVNIDSEEQKSGVEPEDAAEIVDFLVSLGLRVTGLMSIPAIPTVPEDNRDAFRRLRELRDELAADHPDLKDLSMGMTDDFEVAIAEGASFIRVGRAIFGERK